MPPSMVRELYSKAHTRRLGCYGACAPGHKASVLQSLHAFPRLPCKEGMPCLMMIYIALQRLGHRVGVIQVHLVTCYACSIYYVIVVCISCSSQEAVLELLHAYNRRRTFSWCGVCFRLITALGMYYVGSACINDAVILCKCQCSIQGWFRDNENEGQALTMLLAAAWRRETIQHLPDSKTISACFLAISWVVWKSSMTRFKASSASPPFAI